MLTLSKSKSFLSVVLFTCVLLVLSSAAVFASEETPLSSEVSFVIPDEYNDPVYDKLASGTRAVDPGTTYTIDDIYRVLNNNIRIGLTGENADSSYSLPRIASYLHWLRTSMATAGGGSVLDNFDDNLAFLPSIYSSAQQIHADGQNNSYYLSSLNSNFSTSWNTISNSYSFTRTSPSGSNLTSDFWQTNFYCYFTGLNSVDNSNPNVFRFLVPIRTYDYISDLSQVLNDFEVYILRNSQLYKLPIDLSDVYFETTYHGTFVYLFGFDISDYLNDVVLHFSTSQNIKYYNSNSAGVSYLSFNSYYAQILKTAFYQESSSKSFGTISSDVDRLANYLANPDKLAAENASQAVIDDTLDGFTGSGAAAAKTSDTGSMKNMSGSIQNGLNSGASASNAASVFSNQTFWSWFTQATSDGINSPYPAPVVNSNTRLMSNGDSVPDFLSGNQAELNDLLNQRNSW